VSGQELLDRLRAHPYCAAVKGEEQLDAALSCRAQVLFILRGDGLELQPMLRRIHLAGKLAAVHLDLVAGTGRDHAGVRWLVRSGADALISSHGHLVRTARAAGVVAIQRLLLTDRDSIEAGLHAVERAQPDLVELLPGAVLPHVADLVLPRLQVPLLAGGFVTSRATGQAVLAAGAVAISTSTEELWT
jgi:glycerol uptake operon antiterminator